MVYSSLKSDGDLWKAKRYKHKRRLFFVGILTVFLLTAMLFSVFNGTTSEVSGPMNLYIVHAPVDEVRAFTKSSDVLENYNAFVLVKMTEAEAEKLKMYGIPVENAEYMERVNVPNYPFTATQKTKMPTYLQVEDSNYYIIKFRGPIKEQWKTMLESMGLHFRGYIPYNAFLVSGDEYSLRAAGKLPFVEYAGIYQPAYRIEPQLLSARGIQEIKITLFKEVSPVAVAKQIIALGGTVESWSYGVYNNYVLAKVTPSLIYAIARIDGVLWIEEKREYKILNDVAHAILQNATTTASYHTVWDHGLYGDGQIIGESDTGIDYDHTMFRDVNPPKFDDPKLYSLDNLPPPDTTHRKIVHYWTFVDDYDLATSGHGTHVAGSIAGNATPYSSLDAQYNGEAPSAKLSFVDIGGAGDSLSLPADLNYLFAWMYSDGARIASQSWGSSSNGYSTHAMNVDQFMWSHPDFLILFANGNSGSNTNTVGEPATAKDCISVGALGYSSWFYSSETLEDIASFSSRGPTADGRIKPTIVSPGVSIDSADSDGDPTSNNGGTTSMDGTSMATPNAAGAIALIRQYFMDGYYPNGARNTGYAFVPSGALLKAMAINSADQATGSGSSLSPYNGMTFPNNDQGFGRLHLENALYFSGDSRKLLVYDHGFDGSRGIVTGETWERKFVVSSSTQDLKVTLAWTDYPGLPGSNPSLVNDLDLVVIAPDGTEYHGNVFTGTTIGSVYSAANPTTYDRLNPEEEVWVSSPLTGTWTVRVTGYSVSVAQAFAVVVTGALDTTQSIELDKMVYSENDTITIRVVDTSATGTVTAHISSTTDLTGFNVTLSETGAGTHVFEGTVQTSPTAVAGALQVSDGDTVTATYLNAEATATIDAAYPSITNLHVENVTDTGVSVVWDTADYTNYTLRYGLSSTALSLKKSSDAFMSGTHTVPLIELQPNTTYYVQVDAWDRVGHKVSATMSFTTLPRADVLLIDDDAPTSTWETYITSALNSHGWTYSVWHYALQGRPNVTYMQLYKVVIWDTADGYPPIDDDDVNLTLIPYLDAGGRLMMIGQDIGWAAFDTTNSPWATTTVQNFCNNYLHFTWNADDVSGGNGPPVNLTYTAGDPVGDGVTTDLVDTLGGFYPDDISNNGGVVAMSYAVTPTKDAVIRYQGTANRTVFVPFAIQDMQSAYHRAKLVNQSVVWLLGTNQHPKAAVTYPNGGETLSGVVTITWTASDDSAVAYADVYYSDDGGNTWYYLGTTTGNSYSWDTTTVPDGTNYLVRVIVYDDTGLHVIDASDTVFTVSNTPVPEFGDGVMAMLIIVFFVAALFGKRVR